MNILTFTTLYPNAEEPHHGIFVENRLRHLVATGNIDLRVIAPVPYFPFTNPRFGTYAKYARTPRRETRHGIPIDHPRYLLPPKIGMHLAPFTMYLGARSAVRELLRQGFKPDLIDAHYFYPDGIAAALIARDLQIPFVVTARGTDINLIPKYPIPRREILWAADRAGAMITVCQALNDELQALGAPADKITTLRNGVDLVGFQPVDRQAARARLGLTRPTLLSVGHLIERKGHHLIIEAMTQLPGVDLLIAGSGPDEARLKAQIARLGLDDRVRLLGRIAHEDLKNVYGAADLLVLASSREGWANVLLEAMACGTPVAATDIWGTREVVAAPQAGWLIPERTSDDIARIIAHALPNLPDRAATRAYAEGFSWDDTTEGQLRIFNRILADRLTDR